MEYVFLASFIVSIFGLVTGSIRPQFLKRFLKREVTRKQTILSYLVLLLISFIGIGLSAPDTKTLESVSLSSPIEEPQPASSEQDSTTTTTAVAIETSGAFTQVENQDTSETSDLYEVKRVIDGDTIEVKINGETKTVRYIGINTPETVHPSKPVECFGREASDKNKALVIGKWVRLVKDVSDTDRYGRLLRYVYVNDVFVNEELVRQGYANASTYPPDVAMSERFRQLEEEARLNQRGLWGSTCTNVTTTSAPVVVPAPRAASLAGQCTIKGNINAEEEKIYHVTGCQSYSKTVIDESKGERWFCSEAEALEAGWRKALNC